MGEEKEKIQNLEVKQAMLTVALSDISDQVKEIKVEMKEGFKYIRNLVQRGLVGIIGMLLTIVAFFVKMYMFK